MGSDLKRAFTEDGQRRTHIGGQALIEGVMMRGKLNWAVAVREPDGHMHSEEHPLSKKGKRAKWLSWPLVRGCVALVDSLVLGYKALEIAANHAFDDEDEQAETVAEVSQIGNGINLSVHCSSFYFFFRPYGFEIIRCRCIIIIQRSQLSIFYIGGKGRHKCRDNVHFIACEQKVGLLQPVSR
jgi:hypothetical protein